MPFSIPHKLLFIHIPKNAGTSITKSFHMEHFGHHTIEDYMKIYPNIWNDFYKFCIVRNPWDRVVSCYEYARMPKSYHHAIAGYSTYGKHPDHDLLQNATFEECISMLGSGKLKHQGWTTQSSWVVRDGDFPLDEYLRSEDLGDSYRGVPIQKLNKSKRTNYQEYYNSDTKAIVEDYYREDLERFTYEF